MFGTHIDWADAFTIYVVLIFIGYNFLFTKSLFSNNRATQQKISRSAYQNLATMCAKSWQVFYVPIHTNVKNVTVNTWKIISGSNLKKCKNISPPLQLDRDVINT